MFRRMPGRVKELQFALAELPFLAVMQRSMGKRYMGIRSVIELCSRQFRQFARAGDMIGVDMRFDHILQRHAIVFDLITVLLRVALRINHRAHADCWTSRDVGGAGFLFVEDLAEVHRALSNKQLHVCFRRKIEKMRRTGELHTLDDVFPAHAHHLHGRIAGVHLHAEFERHLKQLI